jgi:hypothetical protein
MVCFIGKIRGQRPLIQQTGLKNFREASAVSVGLQVLVKHHGHGANKEPAGISDLQAVFL